MTVTIGSKIRVHIRWMIRKDMNEILRIEREAFANPWFEEDFIRCLRQRNCIGMVAEHGEKVLGYMVYELHKGRLYIMNFAVNPDCNLRGVGTQMMEKLIGKLGTTDNKRTLINCHIRETNLEAQLFFKKCGFLCTKIVHDFYDNSSESAYLFEYFLDRSMNEPIYST